MQNYFLYFRILYPRHKSKNKIIVKNGKIITNWIVFYCQRKIISEKSSYNILGFRFEPMKKPRDIRSDKPGSDSNSSWIIESSDEEFFQIRFDVEILSGTWCKCRECQTIVIGDEWYMLPWTRVFLIIWIKGLETKFILFAFLSFCNSIFKLSKIYFRNWSINL